MLLQMALFHLFLWLRWHPTSVLLPGKSHGRRSPVGCSPWGRSESDRTERLHFHFSPSCIGEGNGNPLQCSCLENPRDWGAWWAAVYRVAQSRTRLKRLSSSSSSILLCVCVCVYHIFFVHSFVDGQFRLLPCLPTVNTAAVNIWVHVSFLKILF